MSARSSMHRTTHSFACQWSIPFYIYALRLFKLRIVIDNWFHSSARCKHLWRCKLTMSQAKEWIKEVVHTLVRHTLTFSGNEVNRQLYWIIFWSDIVRPSQTLAHNHKAVLYWGKLEGKLLGFLWRSLPHQSITWLSHSPYVVFLHSD